MDSLKDKLDNLAEHTEEFADTYYKLALLNVTEKAAGITSAAVTMIIISTTVILGFLFGGFALSWWLGDLLKSRAGGFLIGAGFLFMMVILVLLFQKKLIFPFIRNLIIRKVYD